VTYVKALKLSKQNVMVNNVEGLFEVNKQYTNRALAVKSLEPLVLNSD